MTTSQTRTDLDDVRSAAVRYCVGIHTADVALFEGMCHEAFHMAAKAGSGEAVIWDKAAYLARISSRKPFEGAPRYELLEVEVSGGEMARVKLRVAVPPRVFEDYLSFICQGGEWKLINKLFRVFDGPALEG